MILWSIWQKHNEKLWNDKLENAPQVIHKARTILEDWILAKSSIAAPNSIVATITLPQVWTAPPPGRLKCNIDAAFFANENHTGLGLCIRDEVGMLMGAKSLWMEPCLTLKEGEALALLEALQWTLELDVEHVIFELDAKVVVDSVHINTNNVSEFGSIILACRDALKSRENFSVVFVKRQANEVVHVIAWTTIAKPCCYDFEFVPDIIINEMK